MAETDPNKLADRLEREAADMARGSEELEHRTREAAREWERKRNDPGVPGAQPPPAAQEGEAGEGETSAASEMGPPAKSDPDRDHPDPDRDHPDPGRGGADPERGGADPERGGADPDRDDDG